ncbi:hypothetical protein CMI45_00310 [Candidatus Pacearchaeota archaeon]|nr:hypothetical protein [Candidatus Pacearchaeota archaeon]|tara:strand:- start:5899 stop:6714 length:816 start_codon:yes stop_codon:yes gene_type:complete
MGSYDLLGNVAIVKFDTSKRRKVTAKEKKAFASKVLKTHKSVSTVLEKSGNFSGRLRKQKTLWILGEKTKEVLYRENGCEFRFNVDDCYFSSRLSTDREEVANQVKKSRKKECVLVMFSGTGIYGIVIGKIAGARVSKIVCVEINRKCNKYALENVRRNKLQEKVKIVQGDVRKKIGKGNEIRGKFDRIVMARPNLSDDFLDVAFKATRKGTIINYHAFCHELEMKAGVIEELIMEKAKKAKKKVKILKIKKAGEIAPYKFRYRVDFKIVK